MPRDRDDVVRGLTKKGFKEDGGDHQFFIYERLDGKRSMKRTKISRGSSYKEISDDLLGKMCKQVGLSKKQFLELIDCPMDRQAYEKAAKP